MIVSYIARNSEDKTLIVGYSKDCSNCSLSSGSFLSLLHGNMSKGQHSNKPKPNTSRENVQKTCLCRWRFLLMTTSGVPVTRTTNKGILPCREEKRKFTVNNQIRVLQDRTPWTRLPLSENQVQEANNVKEDSIFHPLQMSLQGYVQLRDAESGIWDQIDQVSQRASPLLKGRAPLSHLQDRTEKARKIQNDCI